MWRDTYDDSRSSEFTEGDLPRKSWLVVEGAARSLLDYGRVDLPLYRLQQVVAEVLKDREQMILTKQNGGLWVFGPKPLEDKYVVNDI